jgi:hypothetical protein
MTLIEKRIWLKGIVVSDKAIIKKRISVLEKGQTNAGDADKKIESAKSASSASHTKEEWCISIVS